jgi:membrane-bound serine protease (ClpP class)
MEDDIAAIPQLPPVRGPLTSADADRFEVLGQVVSNDRLLTLKPWQAEAFGLSAGTVADDEAMRRFLGAATVIRIEPQWSEGLVKVLLSWPVRVAFIAIFVICVLIEMALPGTGWFGLGGVAALIVLLGAPMLVGLASWWDVAAVLLGIALIAAEILVIPGTIVAGLCGAVLLLVGLVGSVVSGDLSSISGQEEVVRGGLIVLVGGAIGWIGAWLLLRQFDHASFASPLVLTDEGPRDTPTPTRIGLTGTAITDLRPSGRVRIGGETLDAVCSGRWIEVGAAVRISRDGIVVEVEPLA